MLYIRHPNTWDLCQRDEPPKCLAFKTSGAYTQENHKAVENGDYDLNGLLSKPNNPWTQCKTSSWKNAKTICEEDSFVNLKASARGAKAF